MPTYQMSEGLAYGLRQIDRLFETLFNDATVVTSTATSATLQVGSATMTITGQNLTFGSTAQDTTVLTGTLDSFVYTYRPGYVLSFTDLNLDIAPLSTAALAEQSDSDPGAMEDLLYALDWTLLCYSGPDVFLSDQRSYDDIAVSFSGNNNVRLGYGNDRFDAGAGNDVVRGGGSDDTIWGGTGRDKLFGGRGDDTLVGQVGRDKLFGGGRHDDLQGGRGNDILNGGGGNDDLTGGWGADRFVFAPTLKAEQDTIHDFQVGLDRIEIHTSNGVTTTDTDTGFDITDGLRIIHVLGVSVDDLDSNSLLITIA